MIPLRSRDQWVLPAERDEAYELGRSSGILGGDRVAEKSIMALG
jgi:hypothetical protein